MKILHIVPSYLPAWRYGGTIQSVHGLCKALANLGHEVHVFTTNVDGLNDSNVPVGVPVDIDGVRVWYFRSKYFRKLYWTPDLKRKLRDIIESFNLVHLHSIFLWPTWTGARLAEKAKVPYIVSPRGMLVKDLIQKKNKWTKFAWIKLIERHNLEKAAAIHVTSELEKKELENFKFNFPPIYVIPNGIESETQENTGPSSRVQDLIQEKSPFILFLGRINWKKGLDRLIPAMAYIPGVNLVIAGNDEENYKPVLEKLARDSGVYERVYFVGPVYGGDKIALYKAAKVFALPSYSENFGNTVLEAMAQGCPVAVTGEVGLADSIRESGAGVVLSGDPKSFAEGLNGLLSDFEVLKRMGERGKQVVQENFTWKFVSEKMEAEYKKFFTPSEKRVA